MSLLDGNPNKDRFIIAGPFDEEMPYYYIIIADINWWIENEPEVYDWMEKNLPRGRMHHTGMTLSLDNEKDLMFFLLRWAG